ncbi:snake venom 5'-nucleotidase-like [Saccoglossus kowalevskii]|uniref:5'-nucleotidase n=1 Tax=Saccoglossus kowalevskii TaxID=10224 RepID=A0ABM0MTW1_SACKO|nr:PREDICTED: 5'-nucleotidase-like [Saccoglossus kowalevskii]
MWLYRCPSAFIAFLCILPYALCDYKLTLLHTNDVHARFEETDVNSGSCDESEKAAGECYAGVSRRMTEVERIRERDENVLLLDAGDEYQGTMWFFVYKGKATSHFMNWLDYDAMAIGNHEFDNGIDGLTPFLDNVTFPVLSANIDDTDEPSIQGKYSKSTVLTRGNEKIAIIGYTTTETPVISSPGKLKFLNEVDAIQQELNRLKNEDPTINKFIALGHSGIVVDIEIANKVVGIDVVIGGHSNTFLYTGVPPSTEVPMDEYPILIHPPHDSNLDVLVVQDYAYGKYLGELEVTFDDDGNLIGWHGNPILLDNSTAEDPDTLSEIMKWTQPLEEYRYNIIGRTNVNLIGDRMVCRLEECNMGNMVTDAVIHENIKYPDEVKWNHVSMAIWNSGGIRASLEIGDITVAELMTVFPFGNTVDIIVLKGEHLLGALEHSVHRYSAIQAHGEFLQMSGIRVEYDITRPSGDRVVDVQVQCVECENHVPVYEPLDLNKEYAVITTNFIANGGDGYDVIRDNKIEHETGSMELEVIADYIETLSPLYNGLESRIQFADTISAAASYYKEMDLMAFTVLAVFTYFIN